MVNPNADRHVLAGGKEKCYDLCLTVLSQLSITKKTIISLNDFFHIILATLNTTLQSVVTLLELIGSLSNKNYNNKKKIKDQHL